MRELILICLLIWMIEIVPDQYLIATKWEQFVYWLSSNSVITEKKMAFVIDSLVIKKIILLKNNTAVKSGYLFQMKQSTFLVGQIESCGDVEACIVTADLTSSKGLTDFLSAKGHLI